MFNGESLFGYSFFLRWSSEHISAVRNTLFFVPVIIKRSALKPGWWNGRHRGLKILWLARAVRVRVPPSAFSFDTEVERSAVFLRSFCELCGPLRLCAENYSPRKDAKDRKARKEGRTPNDDHQHRPMEP